MPSIPDLEGAERFVWLNARLLDRHRYAYLFKGAEAGPVLAALRPYQNPDGGFGNALEPDIRAPVSQPVPVWSALEVLDEIDAYGDPMLERACDYLMTVSTPEGGVPFVLASVRPFPRGPWWETDDNPPASLLPTAGLAALLHKHSVQHPWLAVATDFCWRKIESLESTNPYEMHFILSFLEQAPDRARAQQAFARVGPMVLEQGLVALDPAAPGEVHTPLNFAPRPDRLARKLFSDDVIEAHLDALAAAQRPDGGWMFNWQDWNAAATLEWRAWITIDALKTLRAYGRIP
jgi:hypothetical protein